jgi:uncharacterized protein with NAD-binding domain and iron-sulfur cluster
MSAKKKIAILGGGVGAMATAWRLTSEPDWQERYDITVYQMGWRLGGKGASGRRPPHWRIEEHGLHIWLGFYHNAFSALQQAHTELNPHAAPAPVGNTPPRLANGVFLRCEDAFLPHNFVGVYQRFQGQPTPWMMDMPTNDKKPWENDGSPGLMWYVKAMIELITSHGKAHTPQAKAPAPHDSDGGVLDWIKDTARDLVDDVEELTDDVLWGTLVFLQQAVDEWVDDTNSLASSLIHRALLRVQRWLVRRMEDLADDDLESLRRLLIIDLFAAVVRGLLEAEIRDGGQLGQLDDEFSAWLRQNGALPMTCSLETNPLLKGVYDFVFAFDNGDSSRPAQTANFATAPALRTIFRMCFTYDGSIFWKMRAGMGDTIFTPFYKALAQRGVQFKFFHKAQALHLDAGKTQIERIDMVRQVDTKNGDYQPLVNVLGLDCWPALAQYDQLVDGDKLAQAEQAQGLNLESLWFQWDNAARFSLQKGVDFDEVVFGISLGSVPLLCDELCQQFPQWQHMVDTVKTVCTTGVQYWLKPDLAGLGWTQDPPVMDAYDEPLDTWADMSHLLPMETWPAGTGPANVAYFCGALPEGPLNPADTGTPHRALAHVREASDAWLDTHLADLWPAIANGQGGIDRQQLMDSYLRANVDPSERYVMSVAGSSSARLKANASGVDNLFLAGDWIDNGFNAGCVEASFMSGMQAGNAILGRPLNEGVQGRELCSD